MRASCVRILLTTSLIGFVLAAMPQEAATGPLPSTGPASVYADETRFPDLLHQFDSSLQALATRVSPAVVQITVTGLFPIRLTPESTGARMMVADPDFVGDHSRSLTSTLAKRSDGLTGSHKGVRRVMIGSSLP